jgi:pyrroline-5-carboxylate reductase
VKATVFLGGGRITSALLSGLRLAKFRGPIMVHDRHRDKLQELECEHNLIAEPNLPRAVDAARLLIIAVRPDSVRDLLQKIATLKLRRPLIAVSLAAGVPLSRLREELRSPVRWARAMPSPVARSGRGLTALAFSRDLPSSARREVRKLFSLVGAVVEIPEEQFDAFTVTFSSSHGYHALAGLIAAAEAVGLDSKIARLAATHALADGILAWREGDDTLDELVQEAATPGGTAAAVMNAMNKAGYRKILREGLRAGVKRARKNAKR